VNSKSEKTLYIVGGQSGDLSYYSNITTEIITSEIRAACEAGPSVDCKTNTGGVLDPPKVIPFCKTDLINQKDI
jgi:hypothetical protein